MALNMVPNILLLWFYTYSGKKRMENNQYNLKNHHIPAMKKTWNIVDNPIFHF